MYIVLKFNVSLGGGGGGEQSYFQTINFFF